MSPSLARTSLLALGVTTLATLAVGQQRLFVDAGAAPGGGGLSWDRAFDDLADAFAHPGVAAGTVDEIWVAEGTYRPGPYLGSHHSTFRLTGDLHLLGGFAGDETSADERDWLLHPTVLTGDLGFDDAPDFGNRDDNCHHVLVADATTVGARIDGFVVRAGNAEDYVDAQKGRSGGGLLAFDGVLHVANCHFIDNHSEKNGGAVFVLYGEATFDGCRFEANETNQYGAGVATYGSELHFEECHFEGNVADMGGGLYYRAGDVHGGIGTLRSCTFIENRATSQTGGAANFSSSRVEIEDCHFQGNQARHSGGAVNGTVATVIGCSFVANHVDDGDGGGMKARGGEVRITDCLFLDNVVEIDFQHNGGGLYASVEHLDLLRCEFYGNSAYAGGGAYLWYSDEVRVDSCRFGGNYAWQYGGGLYSPAGLITNSLFHDNLAQDSGGGVACGAGGLTLLSCTLARNETGYGDGGGVYTPLNGPGSKLVNCIAWGNSDDNGTGPDSQIHCKGAPPRISHSCVEGWTGSGAGMIASDPLFSWPVGSDGVAGTADDDYRLDGGSPAIDAGDSTNLPHDALDQDGDGVLDERIPLDLAGDARRTDDPSTPDTGIAIGTDPVVDMGAYELVPGSHDSYCTAAPNSVGPGAQLDCNGETGITANLFELSVSGAPPGRPGLFFYGPDPQWVLFGDGYLCVAGGIYRLPGVVWIDASGLAGAPLDFTAPPASGGAGAIHPGSTWRFQFWFRDEPLPGLPGFNLSDALRVHFNP